VIGLNIFGAFRKLPRDRPWLGLAAGGVFFALASALRWRLGAMSEGFGPMTFLPAILLAGLFGGIRIGLLMAAICILVAWVMFFPPYGTFILARPQIITMVIFILTAALELYVIRTLNLAINDLTVARERANTLFRELQHRVANNLQFVAALLTLRKKTLERGSPGARALEAARTRLEMMARVHRRLHAPSSVDQPVGPDAGAPIAQPQGELAVDVAARAVDLVEHDEEVVGQAVVFGELHPISLPAARRWRPRHCARPAPR